MGSLKHPDLLGEGNPLLEAMAPFIPFSEWPNMLRSEPLEKYDWRSVPPEWRSPMLTLHQSHYWPNQMVMDIADSIQTMLLGSLMVRNPLSVAEQRRINMLALTQKVQDVPLQSLRVPYGGGIISAITGMGKSALLENVLPVIAPQQFVIHGKSEACGWASLTQVFYLVIDAPTNGTRGGVLARIVAALDALLGTNYFDTYRKQRNLDAMLLYVTKLLSNHRVGMLVIDENQGDNFGESIWFRSFVLFYLGLMNLGIPIFLLGNPLAFTSLEANAQLMRRFSAAGYHQMTPAKSFKEEWWAKYCVPGMCRFSVCEEIPGVEEILEKSFRWSGGVPGLFEALWLEAQRIVLRRGGEKACMSIDDVEMAMRTPRTIGIGAIASAILSGNDGRFLDIPASADGNLSDQGVQLDPEHGFVSTQSLNADARVQLDAIRADFEKRRAKVEQAEKKRMLRAELGTEDIRAYEMRMEAFAGLAGSQESLFSGGKVGSPKMR
jgi:hypothetical protein